LVTEAGGVVVDANGGELNFSQGRTLSSGIIVTNRAMHPIVLGVVEWILEPPTQTFRVTIKSKPPPSVELISSVISSDLSLALDPSQVNVKEIIESE